jgi:hypothetical protein
VNLHTLRWWKLINLTVSIPPFSFRSKITCSQRIFGFQIKKRWEFVSASWRTNIVTEPQSAVFCTG